MKSLNCGNCLIHDKSCFNKISEEDLLWMNESKITTLYKKGQIIFHEGRMPNGIYCMKSGAAKISKFGLDGKELIVRFITPGSLLGIRAYISNRNYKGTATAIEDSVICFISRANFDQIMKRYPHLERCLTLNLTQLLEEAENKLTSLAQKPVRERVAESLLILNKIFITENCECDKGTINLSREDLANIVGTATETVIRILSEFKTGNLIIMNGRKIILHDIEGLQKIARNEL